MFSKILNFCVSHYDSGSEARKELAEARAELQRLRQHPEVALPTVHKNLSLISIVRKWSGSESAVRLEEFLSNIESEAKIGRWDDEDKVRIAIVRLTEHDRTFCNTNAEIHTEDITWQRFKDIFADRFKDVKTDQYHFNRLQSARQLKNESPQDFADRCRALSQWIMCKANDPVERSIHRANAERMSLASFVAGLTGLAGQHVRIRNPQDMRQALSLALSATEATKQEKTREIFFASSDRAQSRDTRTSSKKGRLCKDSQRTVDFTDKSDDQSRYTSAPTIPRETRSFRDQRNFSSGGLGHFSECPIRLQKEGGDKITPGGGI
jgi:hypothetical protein